MEFDLSKEVARIGTSWNDISYDLNKRNGTLERSFALHGPKGCGKTKIAQEFVRSHAYAFYISFGKLPKKEALSAFMKTYIPDVAGIDTFEDAVDAFMEKRSGRPTLLVFEQEYTKAMAECKNCFWKYIASLPNVKDCYITDGNAMGDYNVKVRHRTVADFFKAFPDYSREDVMRIHALTGGILGVAKELNQSADYDENVRTLLKYDSAFSTYLPSWLTECFRSPESYYPILKSMADGHCHLSEIAKDVGFANNKCLTYIEALIKNDFVFADKPKGSKQSTYHIANSYIAAWCRYVYGKNILQVTDPDRLFDYVRSDIDKSLAVPSFRAACMRFIDEAPKTELFDFRCSKAVEVKKSAAFKFRDGSRVVMDLCVKTDYSSFYFVFPHTLDERYTKEYMEKIYKVVNKFDSIYNSHITVFSLSRFSDWCVHEASVNDWLHLVTMERLKY